MKRIFILVALTVAIAGSAFAKGLWVGATALYNIPMTLDAEEVPTIETGNLWYGADAALELFGILKGEASAIYIPSEYGSYFYSTLGAGLSFNLLFLNVGVGVGPTFYVPIEDSGDATTQLGVYMKPSVGLRFGKIGVNLYGLYTAPDYEALMNTDFQNASLLVGADVQIRLF